jgi:hypothetical protein
MEKAVITSVEELKTLQNSEQSGITELVLSDLTEKLNNDDIKVSQAAGLIKEIIRHQKSLQKIHLQNNIFPAPELQFIIKAIIDKNNHGDSSQLQEINLHNAVSIENLERSNRELLHLQRTYGDNIVMDDEVYAYFIHRYETACQEYLKFIAKEVILPKKNKNADTTDEDMLALTDELIKTHDIKAAGDNKLNDGVVKYRLVRELHQLLQQNTHPLTMLKSFQTSYEKTRKKIPVARTKPEAEKVEKLHMQVGDIKAESFLFPKKHPNSIFKLAVKKTRKKAKSKAKSKTKSKAKKKRVTATPSL